MAMTEHKELNVHAFVMAERIIRETNGMYGAIGLFSSITVSDQQDDGCAVPEWILFVEISGFKKNSTYSVYVKVARDADDQSQLCRITGHIETKDVVLHNSGVFTITVPAMQYPSPGLYEVSMFINNQKIASRWLNIVCE